MNSGADTLVMMMLEQSQRLTSAFEFDFSSSLAELT
jgi:hypothetical protein